MSYILDALRKAEAERERGSVPGIHAQPAFAGARPGGAPARSRLWLVVVTLGVLLAIVVAVVLYLLLARAPASELAARPVAPASAAVAAAAAPIAPAASTVAPAVATPAQPAPPPVRKARAASAPPLASAKASAAAPTTKTDERIYALNELPDDIRRQLPTLSVGGSMYSSKAADRLVIINGQVLHEGDQLAPNLVVQQIRLKAAVLTFKSYRIAIAF
jgi:general secretion pathway protein B